MTKTQGLGENSSVLLSLVREVLSGMDAVKPALKLITTILSFCLPILPILAQEHTENPTRPVDLVSWQASQFNSPADFRVTTSLVALNLVSHSGSSAGSAALSLQEPFDIPLDTSYKNTLLLPINSCPSPSQIGLLYACLTLPPSKFVVSATEFGLYPIKPIQPAPHASERFRWKSAFWQSFGFLVVEHAFRIANDPGARYLLIHKPLWHDYWASADHFHMSKWGDGDSFIVNYIGHPMEGAVFGDIFLNNDPKGRSARFGKSSNYWYSRLKAMAWATAFSTYFEIGPVLSEAAIGNEGGYTYVPGCGLYPCDKYPGKHFKPPTNNTGWVDFVITPLVGTGWIIMEDAIEREFVDRIAKESPALKYKILRGSLAPSHTFANLFAGKAPWFRYPETESFIQTFGGPLQNVVRPAWKDEPRFSLGAQFISTNFPLDSETCSDCKKFIPGYGFDFNYRFAKYAYFDSVMNVFPGSSSYGQHGGAQEGLVGVKLGRAKERFGLFCNLRNGFIHYDKALVPGSPTSYESTWRYAIDLGGTVDFYASRNSSFRFSAGTTLIHYLQGYTDPKQPPTSVISTQYYSFKGSPYITSGYVFRF